MWVEMLAFGTFVGIGLVYRRKPEVHRPMMLLATVVIQSGTWPLSLHREHCSARTPICVWGPVLLLGGLLFLLQWAMRRATNRPYLLGYAGLVVASFVSVAIGSSALWQRMVSSFVP